MRAFLNKDVSNTKKEFINYKLAKVNMEKTDLNDLYIVDGGNMLHHYMA